MDVDIRNNQAHPECIAAASVKGLPYRRHIASFRFSKKNDFFTPCDQEHSGEIV